VRQLLAESLLLAVFEPRPAWRSICCSPGCSAGSGFPHRSPIEALIQRTGGLLAYSIGIAGLVTMWQASRRRSRARGPGIGAALKEHERQLGPGRWTLRNALVAGQLAVSIVLLSGGLVFLRSLLHATALNAGFDTAHTVLATIRPVPESSTAARFDALTTAGMQSLRMLPDVESVALAQMAPLKPVSGLLQAQRGVPSGYEHSGDPRQVQLRCGWAGVFSRHGDSDPAWTRFPRFRPPGRARRRDLNENLARLLFRPGRCGRRTIRLSRDNGDVRVGGRVRGTASTSQWRSESRDGALTDPAAQPTAQGGVRELFIRARARPDLTLRQVDATLSDLDSTVAVETRPCADVFSWALAAEAGLGGGFWERWRCWGWRSPRWAYGVCSSGEPAGSERSGCAWPWAPRPPRC